MVQVIQGFESLLLRQLLSPFHRLAQVFGWPAADRNGHVLPPILANLWQAPRVAKAARPPGAKTARRGLGWGILRDHAARRSGVRAPFPAGRARAPRRMAPEALERGVGARACNRPAEPLQESAQARLHSAGSGQPGRPATGAGVRPAWRRLGRSVAGGHDPRLPGEARVLPPPSFTAAAVLSWPRAAPLS
jgi:hypothetical protein